jgi:hypothetical protein
VLAGGELLIGLVEVALHIFLLGSGRSRDAKAQNADGQDRGEGEMGD